ncbi:MAG: hypothetical protein BGO82_07795 [Devosia sp. 67-54]|nr:hypothetical protein [Devosia sp.]ODU67783.1 MAG: hypothetical protein ABT00_20245 [Bordetella sp. SCN 68-11]OJX19804.1 MAG: hypothetical protein BGO82_07795 [Devosia sp. 67-54]
MTPGGQLPVPKLAARLVVLVAFDRDDGGTLRPAFEPREMPDERRAIAAARMLSHAHAGVVAWARDANVAEGEYGPPEVLYQAGDVPEMD